MRPIRCTRERPSLCSARPSDLRHRSFHKLPGSGHHKAASPYLAHVGSDEVGLHELNRDTLGSQFGAQGCGPLLQESFGAGIGREKGGGDQTAEGAHREDEAAFPLSHARSNRLGHTQSSSAVDRNDPVNLLLWRLKEWHRDRVRRTHVIDQNRNIQPIGQRFQLGVVAIQIGSKVHCESLGGGIVFLLDLGSDIVKFRLGAGDEEGAVAGAGEVEGELFADAIGSTGDDGPGFGRGAEGAELEFGG